MSDQERASQQLWREILRDFETLARLLDRAIESGPVDPDEVEILKRAKMPLSKELHLQEARPGWEVRTSRSWLRNDHRS